MHRRGRLIRFLAGFGVAALLTLVPGSLLPPLGAVLTLLIVAGIAVWYVVQGYVRTDGTAFLVGLLLGAPVLLLIFVVAGLASAILGLVLTVLPFLELLRYVV